MLYKPLDKQISIICCFGCCVEQLAPYIIHRYFPPINSIEQILDHVHRAFSNRIVQRAVGAVK